MRDSKLIRVISLKQKPFKNLCPEISHYRGSGTKHMKFLYKACGVNPSEYTHSSNKKLNYSTIHKYMFIKNIYLYNHIILIYVISKHI